MSYIHFKVISSKDFQKITFDGVNLSLKSLKTLIINQAKLNTKKFGYDLEIKNADTKEVYKNENDLILKNTRVIANRVFKNLEPLTSLCNAAVQKVTINEQSQTESLEILSETNEFPKRKPPKNYICLNCNQHGHFQQDCPKSNSKQEKRKKASGIPNSFLIPANSTDPDALLGCNGSYVKKKIDKDIKQVKKKYQPFLEEDEKLKNRKDEDEPLPDNLMCPFTEHGKHLIKDAVIIPCCGKFVCCDECICYKISNDELIRCPIDTCDHEIDYIEIAPHHEIRNLVNHYLKINKFNKTDNKALTDFNFLNDKFKEKINNKRTSKRDLSSILVENKNNELNKAEDSLYLPNKTDNELAPKKIKSSSSSIPSPFIKKEATINSSEVDVNSNGFDQNFNSSFIHPTQYKLQPIMYYSSYNQYASQNFQMNQYYPQIFIPNLQQYSNQNYVARKHNQVSFNPNFRNENCKKRKRSISRSFAKRILVVGE